MAPCTAAGPVLRTLCGVHGLESLHNLLLSTLVWRVSLDPSQPTSHPQDMMYPSTHTALSSFTARSWRRSSLRSLHKHCGVCIAAFALEWVDRLASVSQGEAERDKSLRLCLHAHEPILCAMPALPCTSGVSSISSSVILRRLVVNHLLRTLALCSSIDTFRDFYRSFG